MLAFPFDIEPPEYNAPCHYDSSNSALGYFLTSTSGVFPHTSQISGISSSFSSSFFSPSTSASSCSPPLFFWPPAPSAATLSGSSSSRPRILSRARRFLGSPWTCCFHGGDEVQSLVMHAMPKSLGKIYASPPCERNPGLNNPRVVAGGGSRGAASAKHDEEPSEPCIG